jgi:methylase of polypeptide subunit release factors
MDGELHFAPLDADKPLRILDIGTGTGIWAMDMADKYPNSEVVSISRPIRWTSLRYLPDWK